MPAALSPRLNRKRQEHREHIHLGEDRQLQRGGLPELKSASTLLYPKAWSFHPTLLGSSLLL